MGEAHHQRTCIGTDIPRSQDREHPIVLWPDICDNSRQILVMIGQLFVKIYSNIQAPYTSKFALLA
jgi:hypothetical protein